MLSFEMERPRTLAEAVRLLSEEGRVSMAKAGGTDLLVWMKKHAVRPDLVVDLSAIPELREVAFDAASGLSVGACASLNDLAEHPQGGTFYRALVDGALSHSDHVIRNKATLVGNLCSSVPSGDLIPPACVHEAVLHLTGPRGERSVPMRDFITGPRRNVLARGEIVTRVTFPLPEGPSAGCYIKLGRRNALDLAQVGVACLAVRTPRGLAYRLAFGAVAPAPVRVLGAEALLAGVESPDEALLDRVAGEAMGAVNPITDVRASREYRLAMVGELTKKAIRTCLERL